MTLRRNITKSPDDGKTYRWSRQLQIGQAVESACTNHNPVIFVPLGLMRRAIFRLVRRKVERIGMSWAFLPLIGALHLWPNLSAMP